MKITATRSGQQTEFEVESDAGTNYYRTSRDGRGLWIKHADREEWRQMDGTDQFSALCSEAEAARRLRRRLDMSGL